MNDHTQAVKIMLTLHDNINSYQAGHIEAVYPLLNSVHNDPMAFKTRSDMESIGVWSLLLKRALITGCRTDVMTGVYRNYLESEFRYLYSHINWYTTSQSPNNYRPKIGTEPQRYALVHGLIAYLKKDIDYRLIPDYVVNELFNDLERRYYTEVYKDDFNKNSEGDA